MLSYNLIIREFIIICACIFLCFLLFFSISSLKFGFLLIFFNFILQYLIDFLISVHDLFQFVW
jgi:hypothetical protein